MALELEQGVRRAHMIHWAGQEEASIAQAFDRAKLALWKRANTRALPPRTLYWTGSYPPLGGISCAILRVFRLDNSRLSAVGGQ